MRAGSHDRLPLESLALPILDQLVSEEKNIRKFDFAFIDADKANYHERLLKLVHVGRIIAYDNTFWCGTVVVPDDEPLPGALGERPELVHFTKEFNIMLAVDKSLEVSMLSVADGLTLSPRCLMDG